MKILYILVLISASWLQATDIYIASKGLDTNPGTKALPFKTLKKASSTVQAGDTIFIRGGTYPLGIYLNFSGTQTDPITITAYKNEAVLFKGDKSHNNNDFRIRGHWLILKNFEIKHSYNGLLLEKGASHNIIDSIISHENHFSGFVITRGAAYNTIINCDAYKNFDKGGSLGDGGHADGFGTGSRIGEKQYIGPGNRFINCSAWLNSDDGFDLWKSGNPVTLINCKAYSNGFAKGDGNGFKLGPNNPLLSKDKHVVIHSQAWDNKQNGFDFNENEETIVLYKNTSYNNGVNYKFMHKTAHIMIENKSIHTKSPNKLSKHIIDINNDWNSPEKFTASKNIQNSYSMVIIGDSTVADYPLDSTLGGWGEFLPYYFPKSNIKNFSKSGKSSKTFYLDGLWEKAYQTLKKGDLLLIQFGHNDSHVNAKEGTTLKEYKNFLTHYITKAKEKGAYPILVSPMHRLNFNDDGTLKQYLKKYETTMIAIAKKHHIHFINLYGMSEKLFESLGRKNARFLSHSLKDTTHFSKTGAAILASLVADKLTTLLNPNY